MENPEQVGIPEEKCGCVGKVGGGNRERGLNRSRVVLLCDPNTWSWIDLMAHGVTD